MIRRQAMYARKNAARRAKASARRKWWRRVLPARVVEEKAHARRLRSRREYERRRYASDPEYRARKKAQVRRSEKKIRAEQPEKALASYRAKNRSRARSRAIRAVVAAQWAVACAIMGIAEPTAEQIVGDA